MRLGVRVVVLVVALTGCRGHAAESPATTTLAPATTATTATTGPATTDAAAFVEFRSGLFPVSFEVPAGWTPTSGYMGSDAFSGPTGFFVITGQMALSIDAAAEVQANHRLRPYGSAPVTRALTVVGQAARLVSPSVDAPLNGGHRQAVAIVTLPTAVVIGGTAYAYLSITAEQTYLDHLLATLRWT